MGITGAGLGFHDKVAEAPTIVNKRAKWTGPNSGTTEPPLDASIRRDHRLSALDRCLVFSQFANLFEAQLAFGKLLKFFSGP
jgi:hypothetical protein